METTYMCSNLKNDYTANFYKILCVTVMFQHPNITFFILKVQKWIK